MENRIKGTFELSWKDGRLAPEVIEIERMCYEDHEWLPFKIKFGTSNDFTVEKQIFSIIESLEDIQYKIKALYVPYEDYPFITITELDDNGNSLGDYVIYIQDIKYETSSFDKDVSSDSYRYNYLTVIPHTVKLVPLYHTR
jgi:hypothetical protein